MASPPLGLSEKATLAEKMAINEKLKSKNIRGGIIKIGGKGKKEKIGFTMLRSLDSQYLF